MTAPKPVDTPVALVELPSAQVTLSEGASVALQVTVRDGDGRAITDRTTFWSTSDSTVARVSAVGLVTAVRIGTARIAVSVDGQSATTQVTVTSRPVSSVLIPQSAPSLLAGASVQLSARTLDADGNELTGRAVFWGSSDEKIAVVDVTGLVTGISPGVATITATSENRTAAVGITVAPVPVAAVQVTPARDSIVIGQSTQLTATPRDSTGQALLDRLITWSSSASAIATVSSSGLVVGVAPGTATITASSEGRSSTAVVVVQPRPVGAIIVSPGQSSLTPGQTQQLTVQITDDAGNLLTGRPISYASNNPSVAQVSSSGLITAAAPGNAIITVTSEGKVGTSNVAVVASPIASLRITPTTAALLIGGTTRLVAAALDASGNVLAQRPVSWTSGAPSVVTVAADGTVTAVGAGSALVFASAEGRLASAAITVTSVTPTTINVVPGVATVIAGANRDLVAELRNAAGQLITGRAVAWSSSNVAVAIVSSTGRVRGVSPGTARIDATADGITGSAAITVVPVPVASVTVNLAASTLLVGGTTQATAVALDASGGVLTGRAVTWSSANTAVATVSATGVVTAVTLGTAAIRATVEGIVGSGTLTVGVGSPTAIAANSVTTQSAPAGTNVATPPSVRVTDAGGSPVNGVNVVFTVTGGAGTSTPASPATVTTGANGVATLTSWRLGNAAGANTLTAAVTGLSGSPVTFSATGVVGAASAITANSVTTQSATIGTAVSAPPRVRVTDAAGNPVSGVVVTFAVTAGLGNITPSTVTTNAQGIASLTSWTLGLIIGTNTVTATATGLTGSPVTFNATGTLGLPTTILSNSLVTQLATVGSATGAAPSVRVTDIGGNPVSGVNVVFTVTAGGGSIVPASPATVATNASGIATLTSWTLGTTIGANTVTAAVSGLTGSPVTFAATGTVGPASIMTAVSATTQSALAGSAVTAAPSVRVTDAFGNVVTGANVTFAVTSGGGTTSPASPATVATGTNGIATLTSWTLGVVAGGNSLTASVAGLTGSPITFNATGQVGPPSRLGLTTQPGGATSGVAFTTQPVVEIRDANGNRTTSNAAVTVAVGTGTGTLTGTTTINAVNGVATFTDLAITGTGAHTLTFVAIGLTSVTSNSFSLAIGAPTAMVANSPTTQSATAGTLVASPPSVKVTDATGNGVPGVGVTFTVTSGGGTTNPAGPTTVATDAAGVAALNGWTLGTVAGPNSISATVAGLTGSPVTFNATGTVGAPVAIAANSTTTQSGAAGAAVGAPPSVRVVDAAGNGVSGITVSFTVTSGGGSTNPASPASVVTNASGIATLASWTLGAATGANTLTAAAAGLTGSPITFTATATAGAATNIAATSATNQSATVGTAVAAAPSVLVTDASNNPVSGVTVTFAVTAGGGSISPAAPANVVTNASGIAVLSSWTLGNTAGVNTVTATAGGLTGSPVSFNATATAGPATTIAATSPTTQSTAIGAAVASPPTVRVTDALGNGVLGVTVTFTVTSGGGTINPASPASVVTNASGNAALTSWTVGGAIGANSVTADAAGLTGTPVTFTANGTAGAAANLAANSVTVQSATAGTAVSAPPSVKVTDAGNNPVSGVNVTFTVTAGGGSSSPASPATVATDAGGIATLTSWTLGTTAGANSLSAAVSGLAGSPVTFDATGTVGPASQLTITTQPAGATNGATFGTQPVVTIRDANGNQTTSGAAVTAAIATGSGTLSGTTVVNAVNGVATFTDLSITGLGAHTLTFTSPGLSSVTSSNVVNTPGAPTQVSISAEPSGATSGVPFTTQPVVELKDANGNVTTSTAAVTAAIASGSGALAGTITVNAVNGVAQFTNLQVNGDGAHTLSFSSTGLTVATSASFVVTQVPAALVTQVQPSGATTGATFTTQPVVQVRDNAGLVASTGVGATIAVTASIASGGGTLGGTTTVNAVNGVATFTDLSITGVGVHTLRFATGAPALSVTSATVTIGAGAATTIAANSVVTQSATVGTLATAPSVKVTDAGNNPVSGVAVTFTVTAGGGSIAPASPATVNTDVNGLATLTSWTLGATVGANTVTATAAGLAGSPVTFDATGTVGAASQIVITTQPAGAVNGAAFTTQPIVELRDAGNNLTSSTASVTAAIATGTGALVGTTTVSAVNGVATFTDLQINGGGAYTLRFTSTGLTDATSATVTVSAGAPTQLAVTTQPAGASSGAAFTTQPVVAIRDVSGNLTTSAASVVATIASGGGALSGTTSVNAVNGVATFTDLVITGTGAHTLTFTSAGLSDATSASFVVGAGAAATIAANSVVTQSVAAGGAAAAPSVKVTDAGNNPVSGVAVTFTLTAGGGTIAPASPATVNTDANGIATLTSWTLGTTAGVNTVTAAVAGLAGSPVTFDATGTVGASTQLAVTTQPAGAVSGVAFTTQPVVEIRDANGNRTTGTNAITVTIATGTGALVGTATVNAVNGVATFTDLQVNGVGAFTLTFTAAGLTDATSASFTVTQTPASLEIQTQPAGAVSGVAFTTQPIIRILDNAGLVIATGADATLAVTVAIDSGPGALTGTTVINAMNGVATFTDLVLTGAGAHTLRFTIATPALGVTSATVTVP